jgi:hypothetical protein
MSPSGKGPPPVDLESIDWPDVIRRLTVFAMKRLGSRGSLADAEDLAGQAIRQFLDPDYASWNPEEEPDLLRHLGSILNGVLNNSLRRKALGVERPLDTPEASRVAVEDPSAQRRVIAREQAGRAIRLLSERIVGDDLVESVFLLELDGIDIPSEQAIELDRPVAEIYKARRRLGAHREAVRRQLETESSNVKEIIN